MLVASSFNAAEPNAPENANAPAGREKGDTPSLLSRLESVASDVAVGYASAKPDDNDVTDPPVKVPASN
jgi:hypothetical protein